MERKARTTPQSTSPPSTTRPVRLRFRQVSEPIPASFPLSDPPGGYWMLAEVTGWTSPVYLLSRREHRFMLGRKLGRGYEARWVGIWGEDVPATFSIGQHRGVWASRPSLQQGWRFKVGELDGMIRCGEYGFSPEARAIQIEVPGSVLTYRATPPFSTTLFRPDGSPVASFRSLSIRLNPQASPLEVVATLLVVGHRLNLKAVGPLAMTWRVNCPDFNGFEHVIL